MHSKCFGWRSLCCIYLIFIFKAPMVVGKPSISINSSPTSSISDFPTTALNYVSSVTHLSPEMLSMVIVAHATTTVGFFGKFHYFFSLGYGLATALIAATGSLLLRQNMNRMALLHSLGVFLYGVRLFCFLLWREKRSTSFKQHQVELYSNTGGSPKSPPLVAKFTTWPMVSTLYVLLYLPCYTVLKKKMEPNRLGITVMLLGLTIESISDFQKSAAKEKRPREFVRTGLYKYARHINYFGEILMWLGVWIGGIPSYTSFVEWTTNLVGPLFMVWLMVTVTKSLDEKQAKKYNKVDGFSDYVRNTPILIPFVPIYRLKAKKSD